MSLKRLTKRFGRDQAPSMDSFESRLYNDGGMTRVSVHDPSQDSDEWMDEDDNNFPESQIPTSREWICQVERLEKQVDSRGRSHYYPARKLKDSSTRKEASEGVQKTPASTHNKPQDKKKGSIIAHVYNPGSRSHASAFLEPESYINIRSPLILKVLQDLADDVTQV